MKSVYILLAMLIPASLLGQPSKGDATGYGFRGNVKTVNESRYEAEVTATGAVNKGNKTDDGTYYMFNPKGKLININVPLSYGEGGPVVGWSKTVCTYNNFGYLAKSVCVASDIDNPETTETRKFSFLYDKEMILSLTETIDHTVNGYSDLITSYKYDEKGRCIEERNVVTQDYREIVYDERGNVVESRWLKANGELTSLYKAKYDAQNRKTWEASYTGTSTTPSAGGEFEYNKQGDVIRAKEFNEMDGQWEMAYEYKYDAKGNWTDKTVYNVIDGKKEPSCVIQRTISYYPA